MVQTLSDWFGTKWVSQRGSCGWQDATARVLPEPLLLEWVFWSGKCPVSEMILVVLCPRSIYLVSDPTHLQKLRMSGEPASPLDSAALRSG